MREKKEQEQAVAGVPITGFHAMPWGSANHKKPEDLIGEIGLLKELTKALQERALEAELTDHLGYEKHAPMATKDGNARNGKSAKTIKGAFGKLPIEIPRDRDSSFEPIILPKGQTRFAGFDDKIISLSTPGG